MPPGYKADEVGDDLAYVMFTSGSTGTAKAVMITHAGLAEHNRVEQAEFGLASVRS